MKDRLEYEPVSPTALKSRRQRWARRGLLVLVAIPVVIVTLPFACFFGMLALRDLRPNEALAAHLAADLMLATPVPFEEVNDHRVWVGMDSAAYYQLEMKPADIPTFLESLRVSAKRVGWTVQEGNKGFSPMGPSPPTWFTPPAGCQSLDLGSNQPGGNYYQVYYDLVAGRVFVIWMNT